LPNKTLDPFELRINQPQSLFLEFIGTKYWNDSTLPAYLNAPNSESVLIADSFQIADYNEQHPEDPLKILDEVIIGFYDSLHYDKFSLPVMNYFGKSVMGLRENGMLDRIIAKWIDLKNVRPPPPEPEEPKVLTLSSIGVGFKIYAASILICLLAFALEIFRNQLTLFIRAQLLKIVIELLC